MKPLNARQIELGSMILTIINMGQDGLLSPAPISEKDVRKCWSRFLDAMLLAGTEQDVVEIERSYWARELKERNNYEIKTVEEYAAWLLAKQ